MWPARPMRMLFPRLFKIWKKAAAITAGHSSNRIGYICVEIGLPLQEARSFYLLCSQIKMRRKNHAER